MNSKRVGNVGEAYALAKLVELGIPVYQQFGDDEPADYLIIINNKVLKVQVKSSDTYDGDKVVFDLTSSTIHRKNGNKHKYTIDEVDLFICFDITTKEIFIVKNTGNMSGITIRYTGINYAANYSLCVETLHEISQQG